MNIRQSFILAIKSLKQSKLRSFLTMLGIIVGVASVFALLTIVNSFKETLYKSFEAYNNGVLPIYSSGDKEIQKLSKVVEDYPDYFDSILKYSEVEAILSDDYKSTNVHVLAADKEYLKTTSIFKNNKIIYGRLYNYIDEKDGNAKCVIDGVFSRYFFGEDNPVGKTLYINGIGFTIAGVTDYYDDINRYGYQEPGKVLIPYNSLGKILKDNTSVISNTAPILKLNPNVSTKDAIKVLDREKKKRNIDIAYYSIEDELQDIFKEVDMIKYVLVALAGISLFVGGIGIMNIMLVTVTERIKEIGIRKSLGANPKEILTQFLIEAATVSLIGGLIGILFGITISCIALRIISNLGEEIVMKLTLSSLLLSSLSSILIGIIFGFFPARKASKMDPIDALSYE